MQGMRTCLLHTHVSASDTQLHDNHSQRRCRVGDAPLSRTTQKKRLSLHAGKTVEHATPCESHCDQHLRKTGGQRGASAGCYRALEGQAQPCTQTVKVFVQCSATSGTCCFESRLRPQGATNVRYKSGYGPRTHRARTRTVKVPFAFAFYIWQEQ